MKKTLLHAVDGKAIACELNGYGISVVYAQPNFLGKRPERDFQAFIDRYGVDRNTPILLSPVIARLIQLEDPLSHDEVYFVERTGWLFSPGEDFAPGQLTDLLLQRLVTGLPVTLIPQTARAVPLESIHTWARGLTKLERALLKCVVQWQRGPLASPIVLSIAVAGGKRNVPKWSQAVSWTDASRWFSMPSRRVRRLMPRGAAKPAEE